MDLQYEAPVHDESFENTLGMKLRGAYLTLHRRFNQRLRGEFGVTADQFVVLTVLSDRDGITQQELVERCYSDSSTMGALLDLLAGKSLIRRETNDQDRRQRLITLTAAGFDLQGRLWRECRGLHSALWTSVGSSAEERTFIRALDRVIDAMTKLQ